MLLRRFYNPPRSASRDIGTVALLLSGISTTGFAVIGPKVLEGNPIFGQILVVLVLALVVIASIWAADGRRFRLVITAAVVAGVGGLFTAEPVKMLFLPLVAIVFLVRSRKEFSD